MTANLTLAALLVRGAGRLSSAPCGAQPLGSPDLDAQVLLSHALKVPRARLKSHPEDPVDPQPAALYLSLIERRAAGEPLAYLTGWRDFWSLRLAVSPAVLVPRPETELLVERALALHTSPEGRVADLGTGGGALALALASERPQWRLVATDVSQEALEVARANATMLKLRQVEFRHGSWFEPLAGERFDLLVSNPPYVAADDPVLAGPPLLYEPRLALTPGADALSSLRTLVRGAPPHLAAGGWLLLEHGAAQAADVRRELVAAGFRYVRSQRDLAGHERMTEGQHGQI
jgi:release factor glutamine methyltransferase